MVFHFVLDHVDGIYRTRVMQRFPFPPQVPVGARLGAKFGFSLTERWETHAFEAEPRRYRRLLRCERRERKQRQRKEQA